MNKKVTILVACHKPDTVYKMIYTHLYMLVELFQNGKVKWKT